jgi:hypothetical protein
MKRSEINRRIKEAEDFFDAKNFRLPPWAAWSPDDWRAAPRQGLREIIRHGLGWDLTDFGLGNFAETGLLLFTIRNGGPETPGRPYAEKIMLVAEGQLTPLHFHWQKTEDIIVRGGGELVVELFDSDEDEEPTDKPVSVSTDGIKREADPGEPIVLSPGESITLTPRLYHRFYGQEGAGRVLVGEVSSVNDDNTDNRFYPEVGRFPDIEEDEPAYRLLVNDYAHVLGQPGA